jgi:undecaprenyl-diphosphatase
MKKSKQNTSFRLINHLQNFFEPRSLSQGGGYNMVALWIILLLAVAQGILEWLPVSSEGQLTLILNWLGAADEALNIVLFLHIGTMIAVIARFYKDFIFLFQTKYWRRKNLKKKERGTNHTEEQHNNTQNDVDSEVIRAQEQRSLWKFLILATVATAIVGVPILVVLKLLLGDGSALEIVTGVINTGDIITMIIALLLIITGIFIIFSRRQVAQKSIQEMKTWEILVVGAAQGLTILPGVSRSGTTVGTMLMEGVEDEEAIRGSFLLSVPAVLGGNVVLIVIDFIQGEQSLAGISWYGAVLAIFISAIVGYLTIDLFLKLAKKINFGWFCIAIGAIALVITIVIIVLSVTTI